MSNEITGAVNQIAAIASFKKRFNSVPSLLKKLKLPAPRIVRLIYICILH